MEAQSFMELLSGYNLISSETDSHIVQHFVATLSTYKVIINGSVKDLQPIISSVNECINSGSLNGKLNGLIVLEELVKDCSSHVFTQVYIHKILNHELFIITSASWPTREMKMTQSATQ